MVPDKPVTTGAGLRGILQEWAVRHTQSELGHFFDNARVLFINGQAGYRIARSLAEHTDNLFFADPYIDFGVPRLLTSLNQLETYTALTARIMFRPMAVSAVEQAAKLAKKLGAQIMGLGAFTKVVGDAGITVAKRAPLPITTGNSYSASGALWAAHDAMKKIGRVSIGPSGKAAGKAMVVGATGAIGSVCARLLAKAVDEEQETPGAIVHVAGSADRDLSQMDMIVTATSGAGKRILDITRVKPGCVITDVARPLDIPAEDVAKRPDVLVIESGEIQLPGNVRMKDIGLPNGIAYACLAETIVLTLEARFENFTLGRNIEWEKVREIYKMGLKHGMKLAAIS